MIELNNEILLECKSCGILLTTFDDFSYGCLNCESKFIGLYNGIIGMYVRGAEND